MYLSIIRIFISFIFFLQSQQLYG